ncbi:hypothetical protein MCOR25_008516 [Pyricularia grisea]|uniref:Uncharacterized protein n=1 Tax=Pyricularia grisea TaxID=148305 RepID=A0A6P8BHG9_PYRGI|nr:uncharacterized protein PgNI_01232 [Pyricularia grisea]KAI6354659.1 hypothetical protein MCOR25_008516 [Pyricularia grisea]TLD16326.1 hypothetical protein PgNI_01232 [Pyricularia grisea]
MSPMTSTTTKAAVQVNKSSTDPDRTETLMESFFLSNRPSYQSRLASQGNLKPATHGLTDGEMRRRAEAKRAERNENLTTAARISKKPTKPQAKPRSKFFAQLEKERREAAKVKAAEAKEDKRRAEMRPGIPLGQPADQRREEKRSGEAKRIEMYDQMVASSDKAKRLAAVAAEKAERRRLALQRADEREMAEIMAQRERRRQESGWKTEHK